MTQQIDPCVTMRNNLIAAALGLQRCTQTAANIVPLPGTERFIVIGTAADVARLLEIAPAQPVAASAGIEGLTDAQILEVTVHVRPGDYAITQRVADDFAGYDLAIARAVERLLATQSAKQGAQPSEPYAYEEDNGADTELVYAAWFKNGLGKMDPDSIYRPLYLGQPPAAPLQTMDDTTRDEALSAAARDVLAERRRQVEAEGWHPDQDDDYEDGELSIAAACYAMQGNAPNYGPPEDWPWDRDWWKPTTDRRNLVKAGALIIADIERIDRAMKSRPASADQKGSDK